MNRNKTSRLANLYAARTIVCILLLLNFGCVSAAGWNIEPKISVQELYTDNVRLAPRGFEDSDYLTVLTPAITLREVDVSRRLEIELDYALQNIFYAKNSADNDYLHLLNLNAKSELYKEHLFADLSVKYSPQNYQNTGVSARDNLTISDDRTNVLFYKINPYWRQRLGNISNIEISYNRNKVHSNRFFDSDSQSYSARLSNGSFFTSLLWLISYKDEKIDNARFQATRFRNLKGQIRYLLSRKIAIIGTVGYDDNEYSSSNDIDGMFWNAGFNWSPSRRTSVEATYGERFFGEDLFVNIRHNTRKLRLSASYIRTPSTTRSTIIEQQVFELIDPFGEPIVDTVTGEPVYLDNNVAEQTAEVLIRSRLNGNLDYQLKKTRFQLSMFYEDQDYQLTNQHQKTRGANAGWIWDITINLSSELSAYWSESDLRRGIHDEYLVGEYTLNQALGHEINASISVRYVKRNSNQISREYEEKRVSLNISKVF